MGILWVLGFADDDRGTVKLNTPSLKAAEIFFWSGLYGSLKERAKAPYERSVI